MSEFISISVLLSSVVDLFILYCFAHKIMTHDIEIIMNKATPPTDPAMMGTSESFPEPFSVEVST